MKQIAKQTFLFIGAVLFTALMTNAQKTNSNTTTKNTTMKTYLIERKLPGAGKLTAEEIKAIAVKSCGVLKEMGPQIEWVQSYVTGDMIVCVYRAENEALVREHAKKGGFPCDNVREIVNFMSPATATAK